MSKGVAQRPYTVTARVEARSRTHRITGSIHSATVPHVSSKATSERLCKKAMYKSLDTQKTHKYTELSIPDDMNFQQ